MEYSKEFWIGQKLIYGMTKEVFICVACPLFERQWDNNEKFKLAVKSEASKFLKEKKEFGEIWRVRGVSIALFDPKDPKFRNAHMGRPDMKLLRLNFLDWLIEKDITIIV